MSKLIDDFPVPNRLLAWGGAAAAIASIIGLYTLVGGPTPVMSTSPIVQAVEQIEETHRNDSIDQLSRWIRSDKSELYDIKQRMEYDGDNASLHEELLNVEEKIEENSSKRKKLKDKK